MSDKGDQRWSNRFLVGQIVVRHINAPERGDILVMKDRYVNLVSELEGKGADAGATSLETCTSVAIPQYKIIGMAADVVTDETSKTTEGVLCQIFAFVWRVRVQHVQFERYYF
jgi:hypothetical protein